MPIRALKKCLDDYGVKYVIIYHSPAYTAQEIAHSAHIPGRELAKTVMVKVDGKLAMAVMPASEQVDLELLKQETHARKAELALEEDFAGKFPDCELGAMPPFGNLYGLDVYVAQHLAQDEEIAFNAGSHIELVKLSYRDFARVVRPKVLRFTRPAVPS
jgi:Ala-tRNA(Pro) deacylase